MLQARMDALQLGPCSEFTGSQSRIRECLFARARRLAQWGQFWSMLSRRPRDLLALKQVTDACTIQSRVDSGICLVPIGQIRGSQGRSTSFDLDFNPLYDGERGRWLNIARARQRGRVLPPVILIRVGDTYFVKDGHHRISVARALGERDIEAQVTILKVSCAMAWQPSAPDPGFGHALKTLRTGRARLRQYATAALQAILIEAWIE